MLKLAVLPCATPVVPVVPVVVVPVTSSAMTARIFGANATLRVDGTTVDTTGTTLGGWGSTLPAYP